MLVLFVDDFTRTCQKKTQSHPTLKKLWYFKNIYLAKKYFFHFKLKPNDENFFQCSHGVDLFAKKKETVGCQRKNLIMGDIEISFAQKISSVSISSCFNFLFFSFHSFVAGATVAAQWSSKCLMIKRFRVRLLLHGGLFSSSLHLFLTKLPAENCSWQIVS